MNATRAGGLAANLPRCERGRHRAPLSSVGLDDVIVIRDGGDGDRLVSGGGAGENTSTCQRGDATNPSHERTPFLGFVANFGSGRSWLPGVFRFVAHAAVGQRESRSPGTRGWAAAAVACLGPRAPQRTTTGPFDRPAARIAAFPCHFRGNSPRRRRKCLRGRIWQPRHGRPAAGKFWKTTIAPFGRDSADGGDCRIEASGGTRA